MNHGCSFSVLQLGPVRPIVYSIDEVNHIAPSLPVRAVSRWGTLQLQPPNKSMNLAARCRALSSVALHRFAQFQSHYRNHRNVPTRTPQTETSGPRGRCRRRIGDYLARSFRTSTELSVGWTVVVLLRRVILILFSSRIPERK